MSLPSLARIPAPPDPILGLAEAYRTDTRERKINLSSGVFVDESGTTPVLPTVIEAERRLADAAGTKLYRPIDGEPGYREPSAPWPSAPTTRRSRPAGPSRPRRPAARAACASRPTSCTRPGRPDPVDERADLAEPPAAVPRRRLQGPDATRTPTRPGGGSTRRRCSRRSGDASPGGRRAAPRRVPQPDGRGPLGRAVAPDRRPRRGAPAAAARRPRLPGVRRRAARGRRRACASCVRPGAELLVSTSFSKTFSLYAERVGAMLVIARSTADAAAAQSQREGARSARTTRTRRPTAPTSSGRSWPTRTCAPAGRPSSRRCATGSRPTAGTSSRRWTRGRIPGDWDGIATQRGHVRAARPVDGTRSPGSATSTRSTWSATAGSTSPASPPSNLEPFADALGAVLASS